MKTFFIYFCELFAFPIVDLFTKKIEGKENIPPQDNFILASNHLNSLDYWFIGNVLKKRLRTLRFVGAMEDFITLLHSGLLYYAAETITINRKKEGRDIILKKIIENLRNKKSIVLFPEGDTNRRKKLLRGKSGIAELTLRTGVPVIPFGMKKAKNSFKRIIEIGKPLYFSEEQELLKKIRTMPSAEPCFRYAQVRTMPSAEPCFRYAQVRTMPSAEPCFRYAQVRTTPSAEPCFRYAQVRTMPRSARQNLDSSLRSELENNQEKHYMILRKVTNKIMEEISKLSQKSYYYDN